MEKVLERLDRLEKMIMKLTEKVENSELLVENTTSALIDHIATLDDEMDAVITEFRDRLQE